MAADAPKRVKRARGWSEQRDGARSAAARPKTPKKAIKKRFFST
jgi:hypothetical protein